MISERRVNDMAKSRINLSNMVASDEEIFMAYNVMDQAAVVRDVLTQISTTYNKIEGEYKKIWNDPKTKGKFKTIAEKMASVCNKRSSYARNQQATMYRNLESSVQKNKNAFEGLKSDVEGAYQAMLNTMNSNSSN